MPNGNTIDRLTGSPNGQGYNAIPSFVPAGTSAAIIPCQISTTTAAWLGIGNATAQPTGAQTYGSGFDGIPFKVRAIAKVTTKASCNVTLAIMQASTSTMTYTAGNVIATTGAVSVATTSANIAIEAWCVWDSTSQQLCGWQWGQNANAVTSASIVHLTNTLTITAQASLGFELAATFSDTTAGTTMTITEFTGEIA